MQHSPGQSFVNPAHHAYFADPFVFQRNGVYYAVGTGEPVHKAEDGRLFPTLTSTDFIHWESHGEALIPPDPALGTDFWAPEIAFHDGLYYLYYSVGFGDRGHTLRVATSTEPLGPYTDQGALLEDPSTCPFAIDPHPFQDRDGHWYLFYARDFLEGDRPGTALVVTPLEGMLRIRNDYSVVARATHDWQGYQSG